MCFIKKKTAYEMRISDWSSDVCSCDPNVAIARFKRHIAFSADIVEMRSRVVLALRPARNLDHDLRSTADNASKPRPGAPALACSPRTKRAQQHVGAAPAIGRAHV